MKSFIIPCLLLLCSSIYAAYTPDSTGILFNVQDPPQVVAITTNVNYIYDPSDYVYSIHGIYQINGNNLSAVPSTQNQSAQATSWRISERDLGGWEIRKPALYLNGSVLYYDFLQNKTYMPQVNTNQSVQLNFTNTTQCYDAVALDNETAVVDCANYSSKTGSVLNNVLYYINLTNGSVISSSSTNAPIAYGANCTRKIDFHAFGFNTTAWIYRWLSNACVTANNIQGAPIEILNATNISAITSAYVINGTVVGQTGFNAVQVSVFMGDIFVTNANSSYIYRIVNFNGDYANLTVVPFAFPSTSFAINAIYDVILDSSSVSLLVLCQYGLYRIDWTDTTAPYIAEDVSFGLGSTNFINAYDDGTFISGSQNFYYVFADSQMLVTLLRKPQNASFPFNYVPVNVGSNNKITFLNIQGNPLSIAVDTDEDYFIVGTNQSTGLFQAQRPLEWLETSDSDDDLSFTVSLLNNIKQVTPAYNQTVNINSEGESLTGIFPAPGAQQILIVNNYSQTTNIFGLQTFSDPSGIETTGAIESASAVPRVNNLAFNASSFLNNTNLTYNYIIANPDKRRNSFFWISQDNTSFVTAQECMMGFDWQGQNIANVNCNLIANVTLTNTTINQTAVGFNSQTGQLSFILVGFNGQYGNWSVYNATNFQLIQNISNTACLDLESTRSASTSYVYCTLENSILVLTTELTGSLSNFTIGGETDFRFGQEFAPLSVLTSERYNDLIFIQEASDIIIVSIAFYPEIQPISRVNISSSISSYNFAVAQDQLIVVSAGTISNYDLSNLRSPIPVNVAMNSHSFIISSLISSGSNLFAATYDIDQTAIFDSQLPDISEPYTVDFDNVLAIIRNQGNSDIIFSEDENNNLSIIQVSNGVNINVTVASTISQFSQNGCVTMNFVGPETSYKVCFEVFLPSAVGVNSIVTNATNTTLTLNLNNTAKDHNYTGYIFDLFSGPLNGTFQLTSQLNNETSLFSFVSPIQITSVNTSLASGNVTSGVNYNGTVFLLSNNGQPAVYSFNTNTNTAGSSYNLKFPTTDSGNYTCSQLNVYTGVSGNPTFAAGCVYQPNGNNYLVFQDTVAFSAFIAVDVDSVDLIKVAGHEDFMFVLGSRRQQTVFSAYQINQTTINLVLPSVTLNSQFDISGRHNGQIVDFEAIPFNSSTGLLQHYLLFLDNQFGLRVGTFNIWSGQSTGFFEVWSQSEIATSAAFQGETIPTQPSFNGILAQDFHNFTTTNSCNILLVQQYGLSYLVQWNLQTGFTQILQSFYPYADYQNVGPSQFFGSKLAILAMVPEWENNWFNNNTNNTNTSAIRAPHPGRHFGGNGNFVVLNYPFNYSNLSASQPIYTYGVFDQAFPDLVQSRGMGLFNGSSSWNWTNVTTPNWTLFNDIPLYTVDTTDNLNSIVPGFQFVLEFTGSEPTAIWSNYVNVQAFGGIDSSNTTEFSLILPPHPGPGPNPNPPGPNPGPTPGPGSDVGAIVAISVASIIVVIGLVVYFRKKKLSQGALDSQYLSLSMVGEEHRPKY